MARSGVGGSSPQGNGSLPPTDRLLAHAEFLRALARSLVADAHEADDVVQGAYLAALEHPPRAGSNLRAWLGTVARNVAFRTKRSASTLSAARHTRAESTRGSPSEMFSSIVAANRK